MIFRPANGEIDTQSIDMSDVQKNNLQKDNLIEPRRDEGRRNNDPRAGKQRRSDVLVIAGLDDEDAYARERRVRS